MSYTQKYTHHNKIGQLGSRDEYKGDSLMYLKVKNEHFQNVINGFQLKCQEMLTKEEIVT